MTNRFDDIDVFGAKLYQINWLLPVLAGLLGLVGVMAIFSATNGIWSSGAMQHAVRLGVAFLIMLVVALTNIRIWDDDVRLILQYITDASLAGAYVLFPDPWPKYRHHARRILHAPMVDILARLIRPGGSLVLASDHPVAKSWLLQLATAHPQFDWTARHPADWQQMPEELNATRYMKKAERESRVPSWFVFHRKPD